jgi:hypothetical protein
MLRKLWLSLPFALSQSKGEREIRSWFDGLTTNGLNRKVPNV